MSESDGSPALFIRVRSRVVNLLSTPSLSARSMALRSALALSLSSIRSLFSSFWARESRLVVNALYCFSRAAWRAINSFKLTSAVGAGVVDVEVDVEAVGALSLSAGGWACRFRPAAKTAAAIDSTGQWRRIMGRDSSRGSSIPRGDFTAGCGRSPRFLLKDEAAGH